MHSLLRKAVAVSTLAGSAFAHHPHDVIAALAVSPDFTNDHTVVCASPGSMNVLLISRNGGLSWSPMHIGMRGLQHRALEFAPDWAQSRTLYLGTEDGGFQASRDGGASWQRQPAGLESGVSKIGVGPTGPNGGHALFVAKSGNQLYRSVDRGRTFQLLTPPLGNVEVLSIEVSPTYALDRTVVLTTDDSKIHLSNNAGASWTTYTAPAPVRDVELSFDYANDGLAWFATWGQGVQIARLVASSPPQFISGGGLSDRFVNDLEPVHPTGSSATPAIFYAATKDDGIFLSGNYGLSWIQAPLSIEKTSQTDNHHRFVRVPPSWASDRAVFCGTFEGIYVGDDYGLKWQESNVNRTCLSRITAISPSFSSDRTVFWAGYGQTVLRTTDGGGSWFNTGIGHAAGSTYNIVISPNFATDQTLVTGTLRGVRLSRDAGNSWDVIDLPYFPDQNDPHNTGSYTIRAAAFSPDYANDSTLFALSTAGILYDSLDGGLHWGRRNTTTLPTPYLHSVILSPSFPTDGVIFAAGTGVFRSNDGGQTFTQLTGRFALEDSLLVPPDFQTANELFCIVRGGGFSTMHPTTGAVRSYDAGLDGNQLKSIALSPSFSSDNTIYGLTSGGGVFVSTDRGRNWTAVTTTPGIEANGTSLALSPNFAIDQTMFAGTFNGEARSTDGGRTWTLVDDTETYDDQRDPWTRSGNWRRKDFPNSIRFGASESTQAGDTMRLPFYGRGVELLFGVGPAQGQALIGIDGSPQTIVDTFAPTASGARPLFRIAGLPEGLHVVDVIVRGTANPAATAHGVAVDEGRIIRR